MIDIGNSDIVIGVMTDGVLLYSARMLTIRGESLDDFATRLSEVWASRPECIQKCEGGMLASVVPEQTSVVCHAVKRIIGTTLMVLGQDHAAIDMPIAVDQPEKVGHDRIADAIGADKKYGHPLMVVDMGTATTVNVVDREGKFVGGMIIPGMRTSFDALCNRASQLFPISLELPDALIGRNTTECMQSGLLYGYASMIDGLADRIAEELGEQPKIVMTGGLARLIVNVCKRPIIYNEHLLLEGLYHIYRSAVCREDARQ